MITKPKAPAVHDLRTLQVPKLLVSSTSVDIEHSFTLSNVNVSCYNRPIAIADLVLAQRGILAINSVGSKKEAVTFYYAKQTQENFTSSIMYLNLLQPS